MYFITMFSSLQILTVMMTKTKMWMMMTIGMIRSRPRFKTIVSILLIFLKCQVSLCLILDKEKVNPDNRRFSTSAWIDFFKVKYQFENSMLLFWEKIEVFLLKGKELLFGVSQFAYNIPCWQSNKFDQSCHVYISWSFSQLLSNVQGKDWKGCKYMGSRSDRCVHIERLTSRLSLRQKMKWLWNAFLRLNICD